MYVSIRDDVLRSAGYPNLVEGLAAVGLDTLEVDIFKTYQTTRLTTGERIPLDSPAAIRAWADEFKSNGVKMSAFLLANDLNAPDMKAEMAWATWAVRLAAEVGVTVCRIDSAMSGQKELPKDERIALFCGRMQELIAATADTGVNFGVENHGYQGNDPEWMAAVIKGVGSDRFGYTMDTGNFYWAGHPLSKVYGILEQFAPYAKHTHVKNIKYPVETRDVQREMGWEYGKYVSPIYEGDIDHQRVADILKKAGYTLDFCIEDESLGHFDMDTRKVVLKKDADYLKSLL